MTYGKTRNVDVEHASRRNSMAIRIPSDPNATITDYA